MQITITSEEWYPVHNPHVHKDSCDNGYCPEGMGSLVDVPEEDVTRWVQGVKNFEEIQAQMAEALAKYKVCDSCNKYSRTCPCNK